MGHQRGAARRDRDPDNPRAAERWSPTTAEPATRADTVTGPEAALPDTGSDNASTATESDAPGDTAPVSGTQARPEPGAARRTRAETTAPAN